MTVGSSLPDRPTLARHDQCVCVKESQLRRREEKGFVCNRSLELAVYSSKRAIPRRSPPGIANTSAWPSNQSKPTGPSRLPRLESRRFGLRSPRNSYFGSGSAPFMVNYRVRNLDAMSAQLSSGTSGGITYFDSKSTKALELRTRLVVGCEVHVPAHSVLRGALLPDARVVEQTGDRKTERNDLCGRMPYARYIRQVAHDRHSPPALLLEGLLHLAELFTIAPDQDDGAVLGYLKCSRAANARSRAGDDKCLAVWVIIAECLRRHFKPPLPQVRCSRSEQKRRRCSH
jgi:hypothetical protein